MSLGRETVVREKSLSDPPSTPFENVFDILQVAGGMVGEGLKEAVEGVEDGGEVKEEVLKALGL